MSQMYINGGGKEIFSPNTIHEGQSVNAEIIRIRLLELVDGKHQLSDDHLEQLNRNIQQLLENLERARANSLIDSAILQGYYTAIRHTEPQKYPTEKHQKNHLLSFHQLLFRVEIWLENTTEPYPLDKDEHDKVICLLSNIETVERSLITPVSRCF